MPIAAAELVPEAQSCVSDVCKSFLTGSLPVLI